MSTGDSNAFQRKACVVLAAVLGTAAVWAAAEPDRFVVPERIYAAPGMECNVYFRNAILSAVPQNYAFFCQAKVGRSEERRWTWTPTAADAGKEFPVVFRAIDALGVAACRTVTVEVASAPVQREKKLTFALFAASLTNSGFPQFLLDDMRAAGFAGMRMVGSRTFPKTDRKGDDLAGYDGYGGYTCKTFLTHYKVSESEYANVQDAAEREQLKALGLPEKIVHAWQLDLLRSPLVQFRDGKKVLDIQHWMDRYNGGKPVDFVLVSLGANGSFWYRGDFGKMRERIRREQIPTFREFVAAFRAKMPGVRFAFTTETFGCGQDGYAANYGSGWNRHDIMRAMAALNCEIRRFCAEDGHGFIPIGVGIDPDNCYPAKTTAANARTKKKVVRNTNALHMTDEGGAQLADEIAAWLQVNWNRIADGKPAAVPAPEAPAGGHRVADPWRGGRVAVFGDSITDPHQTKYRKVYWQYLQEWLGWQPFVYGISGHRWCHLPGQIDRAVREMGDDVDAITVFLGTNDYAHGTPLGEWYTYEEGEVSWWGKPTTLKKRVLNRDEKTVRGMINVAMEKLRTRWPNVPVLLIVPPHRDFFTCSPTNVQPAEEWPNTIGLYLDDYVKCVREAADVWSCPVADLYRDSGLLPRIEGNRVKCFANRATDGLHPNSDGHHRIAETILRQL